VRVLVDLNVVLDLLLNRAPFVDSAETLMARLERKEITGILASTAVTTIFYLLAKSIDSSSARSAVLDLLELFEIAPVDRSTLERAVASTFSDFEDSVLYEAGRAVGIDAIVTRNQDDFRDSAVPVMSPAELNAVLQLGTTGGEPA
jgi:predicted nucleic acid-binding protein